MKKRPLIDLLEIRSKRSVRIYVATEPWSRLSATRKRHKQEYRLYLTADDNDALD